MKKYNEEQNLQMQMVTFIEWKYKELFVFAVRNEGKRSRWEQSIIKKMGLKSGVSDLVVFGKSKVLFLEVKTEKGKMSNEQKEFEKICQDKGMIYQVCRDLDCLSQTIKSVFYSD